MSNNSTMEGSNGHHLSGSDNNPNLAMNGNNNTNNINNNNASLQQQHQQQQQQHQQHGGGPHGMNVSPMNTLKKPSTTISRPPRAQNGGIAHHIHHSAQPHHHNNHHHHHGVVAQNDHYVHQMGMARGSKPDDYDPDSNVYVANLPSDYGKERLYQLFSKYGNIVRYKFVTPDEPSQPGYGFVQFANRKDAHKAIKNLEGHIFETGETIYLSIALRRRSSLSDEPTNLYIKNLPSSWTNDKLRKVFGAYGQIRQSKVVGDGIGFVRFEDHDQALNAIGRLDKQMVEEGCKLEVRFATRKTAANAYRLQQIPNSKQNENNLYIRNLPKYYNQSALETLFANYGKISSAKINDNGIAFVRFAHAEDAKRAIQELNGKKPPQFEEEIVVKLAHFDIGDSRNRWANKFGSPSGNSMGGGSPNQANTSNGTHFNNNMYQNHFNAPIGSMNSFNGFSNNNMYSSANQPNSTPLPSVPSSTASFGANTEQSDVNVNVNMNNLNVTSNVNPNNMQNMNMMQMNNMNNMNNQMQALQQQMQQWNLTNSNAQQQGNNQFAFPAATPVMMTAPQLFAANPQQMQQNGTQQQQQQSAQSQQQVSTNGVNPMSQGQQQLNLPRQGSTDSNISSNSQQNGGATSPQSNHSGGSGDANKATTWSKKQQQLGDQLYKQVVAKTGLAYAPKITGMLIKMGDKKAQQCIDNPSFLDEQIQIAKNLLVQQDSAGDQMNGANSQNMNPNSTLSPTTLLNQHSQSPTSTNSPLNIKNFNLSTNTPTSNRFQPLNTKPVTPNAPGNTTPNAALTPNQATNTTPTTLNVTNPLTAAQLSSIPNLLTSSIPNSLYGTMPNIFNTPQLFTMSPAPASAAANRTPQALNTATNPQQNNPTTPQQHQQQQPQAITTPNQASNTPNLQQLSTGAAPSGTPQYLFTTIPNLGSTPITVTSPAQQQMLFTSGTPGSINANTVDATQQAAIQSSGWGLALNQNATASNGGINVIQTQPATQFMNPTMFRGIQ